MGFCLMFCGLRNKEKRGSDLFDDGMKQKYHRPRKWQKYPLQLGKRYHILKGPKNLQMFALFLAANQDEPQPNQGYDMI